ncbi:Protein of unknown function [Pyronema omphalodes CBS 100304]|uniref:Uncharacterized protein n=1 Tax=Pyronema omphalodes (strain CBS 100304) TaxID=1076935 RepID=U4KWH1_PYROM|nr:Protein of unknown function [Pyronema omphalodes CBS 100304]
MIGRSKMNGIRDVSAKLSNHSLFTGKVYYNDTLEL